jgi:hypothetical protein
MSFTTAQAVAVAIAQHSGDPILALLTVEHPSFGARRYARNNEKVVSNGETFAAAWFEIELPGDGAEAPSARITVANVDREFGRRLEGMPADDSCVCRIDLVLASTPDTIERSWIQFVLRRAVWDAMTVRAEIGRVHYYDEPFPYLRITTDKFRGISPDA